MNRGEVNLGRWIRATGAYRSTSVADLSTSMCTGALKAWFNQPTRGHKGHWNWYWNNFFVDGRLIDACTRLERKLKFLTPCAGRGLQMMAKLLPTCLNRKYNSSSSIPTAMRRRRRRVNNEIMQSNNKLLGRREKVSKEYSSRCWMLAPVVTPQRDKSPYYSIQ